MYYIYKIILKGRLPDDIAKAVNRYHEYFLIIKAKNLFEANAVSANLVSEAPGNWFITQELIAII